MTAQWKQVSSTTAIEIINERQFFPMHLDNPEHTTYQRFGYFHKEGTNKRISFRSWEKAMQFLGAQN